MSIEAFEKWLAEHSGPNWRWYIKRLAANDTLATGAHQAGPYFPKDVVFDLFPSLKTSGDPNPRETVPVIVDSHGTPPQYVAAIWYNQKSRDECRITGWGGTQSAILDPEATGSIAIFAFYCETTKDATRCHAWLCSRGDEDLFESRHEPIEPGSPIYLIDGHHRCGDARRSNAQPCQLTESTMPAAWKVAFPSGAEIVRLTIELRALPGKTPDQRLLVRRECEFALFKSIEQLLVLPRLKQGFESVDAFVEYSNAVNNRRKSRSGRSLELHVAEIFKEENIPFSHGETSEGNKKPDFLIPSAQAYRLGKRPVWMLAAKTTCKDRWRQVLNEADNIPGKHLITLQQGVSTAQFSEMAAAGLSLVVPKPLHHLYPKNIRQKLLSLSDFIRVVRN